MLHIIPCGKTLDSIKPNFCFSVGDQTQGISKIGQTLYQWAKPVASNFDFDLLITAVQKGHCYACMCGFQRKVKTAFPDVVNQRAHLLMWHMEECLPCMHGALGSFPVVLKSPKIDQTILISEWLYLRYGCFQVDPMHCIHPLLLFKLGLKTYTSLV